MEISPSVLVVNIGFQFFMAGIVTLIVCQRVGVATWLGLRWAKWPWVLLIAPGAVLFMWTIFGGLQVSGYLKWMESLGVETVQDTVKLPKESRDPVVLGLMAFAAVVAAPICEEMVFRGYVATVAEFHQPVDGLVHQAGVVAAVAGGGQDEGLGIDDALVIGARVASDTNG
jgi:membrane protease YdiL (CAAX protease family)